MLCLHRPTNEANARTSAYEALSALATHSASDCLPIVSKLVIATLDRSEALLGMQVRRSSCRRNRDTLILSFFSAGPARRFG